MSDSPSVQGVNFSPGAGDAQLWQEAQTEAFMKKIRNAGQACRMDY